MIKALIVEDNIQDQDYLKLLLKNFQNITILDTADSVLTAAEKIKKLKPALLFLDVELGCQTGFDVLHNIESFNIQPSVIFTTGYDKYAVEAIRHSAFDYLLKPIDPVELEQSLKRLETQNQDNWKQKVDVLFTQLSENKKIVFNVRSGSVYINPDDIFWCEAEGNYTNFIMTKKRKEYITCQIGNVLDKLPKMDFVRLGRSIIINQKNLSRINRMKKQVIFEKEESIDFLDLSIRQIRELGTLIE
jgi:two-component system, LytTR family, response regulator